MTRNEYYLCFKDSTTKEDIAMAESKNLDIVTQVRLLMESDDENDTGKLLALYKDATVEDVKKKLSEWFLRESQRFLESNDFVNVI